jgi:hypothetical protein
MVGLGLFISVCCIAIISTLIYAYLLHREKGNNKFLKEKLTDLAIQNITLKKLLEDTKNARKI